VTATAPVRRPRQTTIERFTETYHAYHEISADRRREQCKVLADYQAHAGVGLRKTTDKHLRAYLASLVASGQHPNTVRKKRSMILAFYGWCFDERLISAEVLMRARRVQNPRGATGGSLPKPYSREEIAQFWVDLDASWPRAADERYLRRWRKGTSRYRKVANHCMHVQIEAICHLALHAGLRRDEIYRAGLRDLHYDNAYIVVRHGARKNRQGQPKPREVPMTIGLERALHDWFELREEIMLTVPRDERHESPWLCLAANQAQDVWVRPMRHERFAELLTTIGSGYQLHRLRHTCGTEWLRNGLALEQVKTLLGHSRIQQTLAYAEILKGDLEEGMGKVAIDFQKAVGRPGQTWDIEEEDV
jgi:site-specific recombinase XerD